MPGVSSLSFMTAIQEHTIIIKYDQKMIVDCDATCVWIPYTYIRVLFLFTYCDFHQDRVNLFLF